MRKKKTLSVFIGRMSPFHNGHAADLNLIGSYTDHLLVLIGSSYRSRNIKNPFTFQERAGVVHAYLDRTSQCDFGILPLEDNPYNDNEWIASVQSIISSYQFANGLDDYQVELVASDKEDVTSYPHWFPGFKKKTIPTYHDSNGVVMAATDLRNLYFGEGALPDGIPKETRKFLVDFCDTEWYNSLCDEWIFIEQYKESWKVAPYAVNFVTTDAVVVQSGHIALIQRKDNPGKDLWALPGGFLNTNERIVDGVIRELREETQIKLQSKILNASIRKISVFDRPDRDSRGRTITHAFYFQLDDSLPLPHIKGSDDAIKAKWIPLSELHDMRELFFNDHYFIIKTLLGYL